MRKITKAHLIILSIGLASVCLILIGAMTVQTSVYYSLNKNRVSKIDSLEKENVLLKEQVQGLTNLITLNDSLGIWHYSHTEVKSEFRIIKNKYK